METAKLDRFAYTHTSKHTHTCTQFESSPILEGECPFCPWPPGQNTNSWLVAEPCNSNKSQRAPPERIHAVTHRPAPSAYSCTLCQIPSLHVLWQHGSPFFSSGCNLVCCLCELCARPYQRRAPGGCGAFLHKQSMNWPFLTFTLNAATLSFFPDMAKVCVLGSLSLPLDKFPQATHRNPSS